MLAGEDVTAMSEPRQALMRRRDLGFVFQAFHVLPHLTVAENVALPLLPGVSSASEVMRANDAGHRFLKLFPATPNRARRSATPRSGA